MFERRGLSNTLGFVLLFALVFGSIVAANTLGTAVLEEGKDRTIAQNAGHSMESMSDAIEDLREENTTTRLSVVRGGGGTIGPGDQGRVTISMGGTTVYDEPTEPIVYRFQDTTIAYETGALIRTQEGQGGVMIDRPPFVITDDVVILPLIQTESANGNSVSGQTITTYLDTTGARLFENREAHTDSIRIEIETSRLRTGPWEATLEEMRPGDQCSVSGRTVECMFNDRLTPDSLRVNVREIEITFEVVT